MAKYWIGVASREHVARGVTEGIAQVCHGKGGPLKRMSPGDWIIYYSPHELFGQPTPLKQFTAIGTIVDNEPYEFQMTPDFIPWRRDVAYVQANEVSILPLIAKLTFIKNKQRWGFPFRRGCFEIPYEDFYTIARAMGVSVETETS